MQRITVLSTEPEPYTIYLIKNFALQNYSLFLNQPNKNAKNLIFSLFFLLLLHPLIHFDIDQW
jgi:hypothetical protein